jgi:PKD domain-containing protein
VGEAYFFLDDAIATANTVIGTSTSVTAHADGTTSVDVNACCDKNGQPVGVLVPVTVTHAPLAPSISGESNVNTGRNCDYTAGAAGGYPPFTYSWSVDGTIVRGQNTEQITANFGSDGSHFVSVAVTDSHSQHATSNLSVNSSTQDPPQVTCPVS